MALHGEVKVNGQVIGAWSARRLEPLENVYDPDAEMHTYECTYTWPQPIFGYEDTVTFSVRHMYGDGAEALAAQVFLQAVRRRHIKHATDGGQKEMQ